MDDRLSIGFIGGGNMAAALASGLAGKVCPAGNIHVVEIDPAAHAAWQARGMTVAAAPDDRLAACRVWIYAVKPQNMRTAAQETRSLLGQHTLVMSVAAGIRADTLATWLGAPGRPWQRLVRCMPNTPALVGAGATGMAALPGATEADRALAEQLMRSVGEVAWVADDDGLDAVTALSGSGPAYVFLFLEALIQGGIEQGLDAAQARQLALATVAGAARLAAQSEDPPAVLRERVTSRGGTTAAALAVLAGEDVPGAVRRAMKAAKDRAAELGREFGA